jgi:hypothetical protein
MDEYRWWVNGSKTTCANCGVGYIQDIDQGFLDRWDLECHPDIRILCFKCMPRVRDG